MAGGQTRQVFHPVGLRDIAGQARRGEAAAGGGRFLFKGYRHGDDAAVKLREGDIHSRVNGAEAEGAFLPFGAGAGADDGLEYRHIQLVQQFLGPAGGDGGAGTALLVFQVAHGQAHRVDDAVHAGQSGGVQHILGEGVAAGVVIVGGVLQAVGEYGQHIDILGFQAGDEVVDECQVAAHPVGAVEQGTDSRASGDETGGDVIGNAGASGNLGMVDALPGHWGGGFVTVIAAEVGVGQKEEQVAEVEDAAAHQVGEYGFHFGDGGGAGGYQVVVPFLVAGAGDEGDAAGAADFHQGVEGGAQGAFAAEQAEDYRRGAAYGVQEGGDIFAAGAVVLQGYRVDGVHADGVAPGHSVQGALRRQ